MTRTIFPGLLIDKITADLCREFPHLKIERIGSSVRVLPDTQDGFIVELTDADQEIVPALGPWVSYGLGEDEAVPIFQAGLRGGARLIEIARHGSAYHWRVEFLRDGMWVREKNDYYSLPLCATPFFFLERKTERVFWNDPCRLHEKGDG